MMLTHAHVGAAPASGPVGTEVAGNALVQVENQIGQLVLRGEGTGGEVALDAQNPLGQKRGELGVAQEPEGSLEVTGGAAWRCSLWSHESSTGSRSNAMDNATCRGMRSQRMRSRASAVIACQR
jgi:hypothetical protein